MKNIIRKNYTGKMCYHNTERVQCKVIYSGKDILTIELPDKRKKNLTYDMFRRDFTLYKTESEKKKVKISKSKNEKQKRESVFRAINTFINSKIFFNKEHKVILVRLKKHYETYKIKLDDYNCGYIQVGKHTKLSYFTRYPNPQLQRFKCKWGSMPKLNVKYEFPDLNRETLPFFYIALQGLLFSYREDERQFIEEVIN